LRRRPRAAAIQPSKPLHKRRPRTEFREERIGVEVHAGFEDLCRDDDASGSRCGGPELAHDCVPIARAHAGVDEENLRPGSGAFVKFLKKVAVKFARTLDLIHEDEHEASAIRFIENRRMQIGTLDGPALLAWLACLCVIFGPWLALATPGLPFGS
jgi:hypothetical protein